MVDLWIQGSDVLLFRDGRPFSAGSDHRAQSQFPPYPSVLAGAMRANQLALASVTDFSDQQAVTEILRGSKDFATTMLKGEDNLLGPQLRGPFVGRDLGASTIIRYHPMPFDAVAVDDTGTRMRRASVPQLIPEDIKSSAPTLSMMGLEDRPKKMTQRLWLDEDALLAYLDGDEVDGLASTDLFVSEVRPGIGHDPEKGTTAEGMLFEVAYTRLQKDVGLLISMEGYEWKEPQGMLKLGGEGRAASYETVQADAWPQPPQELKNGFLVYFATPAYFETGWQPADWSRYFDGPITLEAAAVGRYETRGGYDSREKGAAAHLPSRRFVPAGSVYYFSLAEGATAKLKNKLPQGAITDQYSDALIGYGQVIIKEWNAHV